MRSLSQIFFSLSVAGLISCCTPVWAHAEPQEYTPKPDAVVKKVTSISVLFDDELEPNFSTLTVTDAEKKQVGVGKVDTKNSKKLVLETSDLKHGTYHVKWVAVARDGHKTHGEYHFKVE